MRLRPRYSLLTLLLLTAFIAGGVKLWYGPHHVVERPGEGLEIEYTYTNSWDGRKILQGPRISRFVFPEEHYREVGMAYYRQGKQLKWEYRRIESQNLHHWEQPRPPAREDNPMSAEEYAEFCSVIQREKPRTLFLGVKEVEYESVSFAYLNE